MKEFIRRKIRRLMAAADPGFHTNNVLVSYPKSGVTWLRLMLAKAIGCQYNLSDEESNTLRLTAFTKSIKNIKRIDWTHDGSDVVNEAGKTSDPNKLFHSYNRMMYRSSRVVLLVRDPRDTVVSLYHQLTKRSAFELKHGTLDEFVRDEVYGIGRIIRFYDIWYLNRIVPEEILVISYEKMLVSPETILSKIFQFWGYDIGSDAIKVSVEACAVNNMRRLEKEGKVEGMNVLNPKDPNAYKVRKARVGAYVEEMSPDLIDFCNIRLAKFFENYGYSK